MNRNLLAVLEERGFIDQTSSPELRKILENPVKVYCGFDPTASSLHLGNLVGIMGLAWFQKYGHTPYAIVGGATGMIGDPSGKSSERNLLSEEDIAKNLLGIKANLNQVLEAKEPKAVVLNNFDWFKNISFLDFLRDVGKQFRLGPMLAKDSVKSRLNSEEGMSFTEFSYQLLQGYDFLYLFNNHGVSIQIGGSDQWGNITAGIDLVRKDRGKEVFGITFPLLVKADGQKFGKSEKGAIWLSKELLSPYEFYQHIYRTDDRDVIKLLKMLTFLDIEEIHKLEKSMTEPGYKPNTVQKRLAEEITRIVHGEKGLQEAQEATSIASPGKDASLDKDSLEKANIPTYDFDSSGAVGKKIVDLLAEVNLFASKSEVRRLIKNGGLSLNNEKIRDENQTVASEDLIAGTYLVIASGKKNKFLLRGF